VEKNRAKKINQKVYKNILFGLCYAYLLTPIGLDEKVSGYP
jgi:hypothetical protein